MFSLVWRTVSMFTNEHLSASAVANVVVIAVVAAVNVMARPCRFVCACTPNTNPFSLSNEKENNQTQWMFLSRFSSLFYSFYAVDFFFLLICRLLKLRKTHKSKRQMKRANNNSIFLEWTTDARQKILFLIKRFVIDSSTHRVTRQHPSKFIYKSIELK